MFFFVVLFAPYRNIVHAPKKISVTFEARSLVHCSNIVRLRTLQLAVGDFECADNIQCKADYGEK